MEKILAPFDRKTVTQKTIHLRDHSAEPVFVRRASLRDLEEIYRVACSVGKSIKDPYQGFLIDDYASDPEYYKSQFRKGILELDHFYVAEKQNRLLGFLVAYTKEQWLKDNGKWLEEIVWHPGFDKRKTRNFVVVSKTAIRAHLTSRGIGSRLYSRLIRDVRNRGVHNLFGETVVNPIPNFASLAFRKKQNYKLAGVHFEEYNGEIVTDLVYHKSI